ncbi:MAG TPA: hypothetical protein VHO90_01280, partial [Bacteroidales bacterium]|nr:hypothetical protein [Bacteroidales bacterium]
LVSFNINGQTFYSKGGYVTISGKIKNIEKEPSGFGILEVLQDDYVNLGQNRVKITIDSAGTFNTRLFIDTPLDMGIAYRNRTTEFLISPGDTLELEISIWASMNILPFKQVILDDRYRFSSRTSFL